MPLREPESAATAVSEKSTEELEQEVLKLRAQLARARSAADGRRAAKDATGAWRIAEDEDTCAARFCSLLRAKPRTPRPFDSSLDATS